MGEVSGDDVHIFLPIVGGLFRQLRLSHKGKAQNIGVGAHAANGIGQDGGRDAGIPLCLQNKFGDECAKGACNEAVNADACQCEDRAVDNVGDEHHAELFDFGKVEHHGDAQHQRAGKGNHHVNQRDKAHSRRDEKIEDEIYGGENADADQILSVQLAFIFCVHVNTS